MTFYCKLHHFLHFMLDLQPVLQFLEHIGAFGVHIIVCIAEMEVTDADFY